MRFNPAATINEMTEEKVKVTLTEPGIAGSYVVAERRPDGTLVLTPEREKLSMVTAETEGNVVRDDEFIEHLERVSEAEDDLGDYERE
jgi:DhnA family fructose-bisphosphate aldolase class Ia